MPTYYNTKPSQRLINDYRELISCVEDSKSPICEIAGKEVVEFEIILEGPDDSPYKDGRFRLLCKFGNPSRYPFFQPTIKFLTSIYHPNVSDTGDICLDILKDQWSPSLSLERVLMSIHSLLRDPNPDDPLNIEVSTIYRSDYKEYFKRATELCKKNF